LLQADPFRLQQSNEKSPERSGLFSFGYDPRQFAKSECDPRHAGIQQMASPLNQHLTNRKIDSYMLQLLSTAVTD